MSATPSPSADSAPAGAEPSRFPIPPRGLRAFVPITFQGRLTLAIVAILTLTLTLTSVLVLNRLDAYFSQQQTADLEVRARAVAEYARDVANQTVQIGPVVGATGLTDPRVVTILNAPGQQRILADRLGQADVAINFGSLTGDGTFGPSPNGRVGALLTAEPQPGQAREAIQVTQVFSVLDRQIPYGIEVTLADPYTFRASTIETLTGLLAVIGLAALGVAVLVGAVLARRFTQPLRALADAARALAEGDLASRVETQSLARAPVELTDLAHQFNAMAARLEESVEIIRHDRDRSRDFLADVSHELKTPIAALRTFNELLVEGAAADPAARGEFLEASRDQLERLDWLAQNLLELSKLDSGLVLLDLQPDDLRLTVEQAIELAGAGAQRRGVAVAFTAPHAPIRVQHDRRRIGQVVLNLVANAVKFTSRGGRVSVSVAPHRDGARIDVVDTGVGIDAAELPRIFDRFYRGSLANQARGSGSGLGLSIVKSIVDMHSGTIAVESRIGAGTRFTVTLPRDPRLVAAPGAPAGRPGPVEQVSSDVERLAVSPSGDGRTDGGGAQPAAVSAEISDSSPSPESRMNPGPAR